MTTTPDADTPTTAVPEEALAPTRAAGLARLDAFVPRAGRAYARERNDDRGPGHRDNVSMLSPWIRHRLIGEEEVVRSVLAHHPFEAAERFLQEVLWRTYWKGWLEARPAVWEHYRAALDDAVRELERDGGLRRRYEEAIAGRTGIGGFDDWAVELRTEGYLHNHARMWFASIWIFTLDLPWVLGADFFLRHLLDGDAASNTLSWRWVAGLQTRGKTYLARAENIARYTGGRYTDVGPLAAAAKPVRREPDIPPPLPLPAQPARLEVDERYALLIGEDDCDPAGLGLCTSGLAAIAGLTATALRSPLPGSPRPAAFSKGAVADALARAGAQSGAATTLLPVDATPADVLEWVRATAVRRVVVAHALVGPAADGLAALRPALADAGIALSSVRRPWDTTTWPYATKGFFPFWRSVAPLLRELAPA